MVGVRPSIPVTPPSVVTAQQQQIQQSLKTLTALPDTTIFFQFAGSASREQAKAISAKLAERGYKMPGEERIGSAAGLHEVRYFYEEDAETAKQAVTDINAVLAGMGFKADVEPRSLTGLSKIKPRRGASELWLEPLR